MELPSTPWLIEHANTRAKSSRRSRSAAAGDPVHGDQQLLSPCKPANELERDRQEVKRALEEMIFPPVALIDPTPAGNRLIVGSQHLGSLSVPYNTDLAMQM